MQDPAYRTSYVVSAFRRTMVAVFLFASTAYAQTTPPPMESVTLDQAVERAIKNNPTVAQAAQGILRAEGLLQQARAATMPYVTANFSGLLNSTERRFDDVVTSPRMQGTFSASAAMPVLAASGWAATKPGARPGGDRQSLHRRCAHRTSRWRRRRPISRSSRETAGRRQPARARDVARASRLRTAPSRGGRRHPAQRAARRPGSLQRTKRGSRVTQLGVRIARRKRSACSLPRTARSTRQRNRVSTCRRSPTRPGGWLCAPISGCSPHRNARPIGYGVTARKTGSPRPSPRSIRRRSCRRAFSARPAAGGLPSISRSRFSTAASGARSRTLREADFNVVAAGADQVCRFRSRSEVRLAQETVRSTQRALKNLRIAAQQAAGSAEDHEVRVQAGATTNLEVIDAQRQARDADSAAAVAATRRARAAGFADSARTVPTIATLFQRKGGKTQNNRRSGGQESLKEFSDLLIVSVCL